jgi:short-subunit dehydrogenase
MKETKKIIIVGATSGIGKRMAEIYAIEGNIVGISGRRKFLLDEIENEFSGQIRTECFDVTKNENIFHLESLKEKLGGCDLLIISAGIGEPSKELSWELDKLTVDTNVNGFVEIANWAYNFFVKQGHGHLVTISSIAAERGNSWAPAYSASKSFQNNYFEGLAIKAKRIKKDISITCLSPGFVNTKMSKGNKQFWVIPVEKCARQMMNAIKKKKRKAYISHRWWIIAKLMQWMPYWLYKRVV